MLINSPGNAKKNVGPGLEIERRGRQSSSRRLMDQACVPPTCPCPVHCPGVIVANDYRNKGQANQAETRPSSDPASDLFRSNAPGSMNLCSMSAGMFEDLALRRLPELIEPARWRRGGYAAQGGSGLGPPGCECCPAVGQPRGPRFICGPGERRA